MLTEKQAKERWCPFGRSYVWAGPGRDGQPVTINRYVQETDAQFTGELRPLPTTPHADCLCIASRCMAWRWLSGRPKLGLEISPDGISRVPDEDQEGYCGLAGRPVG
jgi:hypothetical protein